jgi:hypothetical protein
VIGENVEMGEDNLIGTVQSLAASRRIYRFGPKYEAT